MIIAIDGPAGAGKSTVARALADHLGWMFLDTGAMYRAVTLAVLDRGIDPLDGGACGGVAESIDLRFDDQGRILIDGEPGEPRIRAEQVTERVSAVSAHPEVRAAVVAEQQAVGARRKGVVAEGRDTTTVVFPGALAKFYLVASPGERAKRRAKESERGDVQVVQRELESRDHQDSTRELSPLRQAPDAVLVNTDHCTIEGVVARILDVLAERGVEGAAGPRGSRR